jgi:hypothetical protein
VVQGYSHGKAIQVLVFLNHLVGQNLLDIALLLVFNSDMEIVDLNLDIVHNHLLISRLQFPFKLAVILVGILIKHSWLNKNRFTYLVFIILVPDILVDGKLSCSGIFVLKHRWYVPLSLICLRPDNDFDIVQLGSHGLRSESSVRHCYFKLSNLSIQELKGKPMLLKDVRLQINVLQFSLSWESCNTYIQSSLDVLAQKLIDELSYGIFDHFIL